MEALGLLAMAAGGYYMTSPISDLPANFANMSVDEQKKKNAYRRQYQDYQEIGMSYSVQKPLNLELTNLNEAWKPWSAPSQVPTRSMGDFFRDQANRSSYLETYGYPVYFHKNGEMPLATTQQSNPNVEIPSGTKSFRWDPKASLAHYPRVYVENSNPFPFSTKQANMFDAGEPTESEVVNVPKEGKLNRDNNPWGPGGTLQKVYNSQFSQLTNKKGVNRSTVLAPVSKARRNRYF